MATTLAFTMNYQISVADGTVGESALTPVNSYAELEERWITFAWGHDREVHPHRRLVISKKAAASGPFTLALGDNGAQR
jgi:hypothetical protein